MKRSHLDAVIQHALAFSASNGFKLPAFANWQRQVWLDRLAELRPTMQRGLGWDVTDFGRDDFAQYGLTLCTLRNGSIEERNAGIGQTFAEKIMVVQVGQETPFHLHAYKTEDIINRGGGILRTELYPAIQNSDGSHKLGSGSTETWVDGIWQKVSAGQQIDLQPGQSIQIPRGKMHRFWAIEQPVLAAEVSCVNDDVADNFFLVQSPRYPEITEDTPAQYLLVGEYAQYL